MARTGKLTSLVTDEDIKLSQRQSLSTETADKLRELILLEKLPPGMHIPERDLSEALGISRTPMREALRILYALSYCKMAVTFCKYLPQLLLNYRRRSTVGWPIDNILLDFTGGALSTLQLILDCADQHDWSGISGDVVKFGLGVTSMVFDVLFLVQHYVLYRPVPAGTSEALLTDGAREEGEDIVV